MFVYLNVCICNAEITEEERRAKETLVLKRGMCLGKSPLFSLHSVIVIIITVRGDFAI